MLLDLENSVENLGHNYNNQYNLIRNLQSKFVVFDEHLQFEQSIFFKLFEK